MKVIELKEIVDVLEKNLGYKITLKSRKRHIIYGRYLYYSLAKKLTNHSLESIGNEVNLDHTTVIHGLKMFEHLKTYEPKLIKLYEDTNSILKLSDSITVKNVDLLDYGLKC